jgi:hypothetical protein
VLLGWLETQLGLRTVEVPLSDRIAQVASVLEDVRPPTLVRSLERDRWATARECLRRIDELLLCGWTGADSDDLPSLVRDLATVRAAMRHPFPSMAERLAQVNEALERCQRLPTHLCVLADPVERWPKLWQMVLGRLDTDTIPGANPRGRAGSSLAAVQGHVLNGTVGPAKIDDSLGWVQGLSVSAACETVAAMLAQEPDKLESTVICCEDPDVAVMLDSSLHRAGVPTCGVSITTTGHPASQVLPLVLRLCWRPVDPADLLDFISLPICPLPRHATRRLAEALVEQPGLGSWAWEGARAALEEPEHDPDGKIAKVLAEWLDVERREWGQPLPATLVRDRCGKVAQWAMGRASILEEGADTALVEALHRAAGQASSVGELVEMKGGEISEPQIARLLETTSGAGVVLQPQGAEAGGPRIVGSLADIDRTYTRLIWLGLSTADAPSCRWTALDLASLRAHGVDLDDGTRQLEAHRAAERSGLALVEDTLLAVGLPTDQEVRPHPVWLQIKDSLEKAGIKEPVQLEDVLAGVPDGVVSPWKIPVSERDVTAPQPPRPTWSVEPGMLWDREHRSATSLETRLACPLKWVLTYNAGVRPSPIARLPGSFLLKGRFCHQVLEKVFGGGGSPTDAQAAADAVGSCIDERIPLDAAPLAQPAVTAERIELRSELVAATKVLVEALHAGGYQVVGFEQEIDCDLDGRKLVGSIDCLVATPDGDEALIDFKYAGRKKYPALLQEGRAVQLATYARSRAEARGVFPSVAYLVLKDGVLCTPAGSAMKGAANVLNGPAISEVWDRFEKALADADAWLTGAEPVPARPLQPRDEWPPGVEMVIEETKGNETPQVCTYCDFGVLCGMKGVV